MTPEYIVRYARQDQYPAGADLRQAARDSVIRYARHYGLDYEWVHDQRGVMWDRGGRRQRLDVVMWRSEARVTGRRPQVEAADR